MHRKEHFNDELLSAYLDDQLSPSERADVEARLADDADARDLVQELRTAAEAVRGLPRVAAPRDLKASILRAAEQIDINEADGEMTSVAPAASYPPWVVARWKRSCIWAGLTVAAALLIMFLNGDANKQGEIAHNRGDRPDAFALGDRDDGDRDEGERRVAGRADDVPGRALSKEWNDDALAAKGPGELAETERLRSTLEAPTTVGESTIGELTDEQTSANIALQIETFEYRAAAVDGIDAAGDAAGDTAAADRQESVVDRYFKNVDAKSPGSQDFGVVLSNVNAAFGDPAVMNEADAPVYFVAVNVTPEAARNNVVATSLRRNSIAMIDRTASAPVSTELRELTEETAVEDSLEMQRGRGQPAAVRSARVQAAGAQPELAQQAEAQQAEAQQGETQQAGDVSSMERAGGPSGVIAVEASPEQVAAFLRDISSDEQNFTAVAVLPETKPWGADASADETGAVEELDRAATYNRNVDEAMGWAAANWRFQTTGQSVNPVRVERNWAAITANGGAVEGGTVDGGTVDGGTVDGGTVDGGTVDGGMLAMNAADARGGAAAAEMLDESNGRAEERRYEDEPGAGANRRLAAGFGGGGFGGRRGSGGEAPAADATQLGIQEGAEKRLGDTASAPAAAATADADSYGEFGRGVTDLPKQEAAPTDAEMEDAADAKAEEEASSDWNRENDGVTEFFADKSEQVASGKAWYISPLQAWDTRAVAPSQQLGQMAEQPDQAALSPQSGVSAFESGEAESPIARDGQSRVEEASPDEADDLRLQSEAIGQDHSVEFDATPGPANRPNAEAAAPEPAAEPPPPASRALSLDEAAPRERSDSGLRAGQTQLGARLDTSMRGGRPVRVLLFLNVLPAQAQPAAAANQANAPNE